MSFPEDNLRQRAQPAAHNAIKAGVIYCALIYALGFAMGVLRHYGLAPALGERVAVIIEAPLMVLASWYVCGWALVRFVVPDGVAARALMGAVGFVCLMALEAFVSIVVMQRSVERHLLYLYGEEHRLGFLAQILFALIPLVRPRAR
ncbi:MAG: hypothetical protein GC189_04230 [Alphaproteobacteria bacterium]|nr:hypothetical protein [Alphaproteobacteria bacterium]